ncbi:monovalent cation/H+ antiporter subunit G [Haloarcula japonica DSM 6131]|uniref:Monovalent cation/H+ antiporter subunit G n=1 Tax=Haloarcula japonica (strain ATCC 49778 / DSM 6131 / JCM 7785 / NBRC 101032 / NCIMB 13157 / TR-1) TaxID=1227453 RepID=M0L9T3_HALJT|nr:monovalent cation/H(+) antiporter subunit G [Haloarcula japonica]EMA29229.1 monovalent cation/H+ antiporter subunit G [Haloarcula japonica DSM 6131]
MTPTEWAIVVLALVGAFFAGVASIGIVRLPDVYTRAHAASKSDTLGAVLTIAAAALAILSLIHISERARSEMCIRDRDQGIEPWTAGDEEGKS